MTDEPVLRPGGFALTDRALAFCAFPPGARILDLGCGRGATVRHARRVHHLDAWGVDPDPARIAGRAHLLRARAEHLPFPADSVAGVLLECSLSVMDDPEAVLAECRRVLKPGGRLVLSDVYARGQAARLRGCLGRVDRKETLVARLSAQGFGLELFEDCSEHLRVLWAQQVFEKGLAALCAELGADRDGLGAVDCGYCLLVARREGA